MATRGHEFTPKDAELEAEMIFQRDRCCSCVPRLGPIRSAAGEEGLRWVNGLMKVREWTEVAAGPKWKTFIRRFNRGGGRGGGGGGVVRHGGGKFQYDPLSYALNFDEGDNYYYYGDHHPDEEEHAVRGNFSVRYAVVSSASCKDAPPHT